MMGVMNVREEVVVVQFEYGILGLFIFLAYRALFAGLYCSVFALVQ